MTFYIGIEGGGTRSTAVVLDADGAALTRVEGEAGLVSAADPLAAARTLIAVARQALAAAGRPAPADALCCALAGVGRAAAREPLAMALRSAGIARHVKLVTDAEGAMHDAFGDGPGILVIAGTGSVAWARSEDGRTSRAGGWGMLLGDEGSGYGMAIAALRAVAQAVDGRGTPTVLVERIVGVVGCGTPQELIPWAARAGKGTVAELAPHVVDAARKDEVARDIVADAAGQIVRHAEALFERLRPWTEPPALALGGGLIAPGRPFRAVVIEALRSTEIEVRVLDRTVDGANGAASLARAMLAGA
jgi:glucosamine kinase